jgi:hypothetical protein
MNQKEINMLIPKSVPKKLAVRVLHWDDERSFGNSLIVSLKNGWRFIATECHTAGFDTVREAVEGLHDTVPCACVDCAKAA